MRHFGELTPAGQARRLAALAREYLGRRHEIHGPRVRLLSMHSFNTVFRIDHQARTSVVRVGSDIRIHPAGVEDIEARWLDQLNAVGLTSLRNIAAVDESRWSLVQHDTVPEPRVCTHFTWVPGSELRTRLDDSSVRSAGQLLAELHEQAAAPSSGLDTPVDLEARSTVYFGTTNLVLDHHSPHGSLFVEAIDRVQRIIDELWQSADTPHQLHGDFGPHNLLVSRRRLQPIDFQDMRIGYPIQDLGITLADLGRNAPAMIKPFVTGYQTVRESPDLDSTTLDALSAARSLNIMNLALLAPRSGIGKALDAHAHRVVRWMRGF